MTWKNAVWLELAKWLRRQNRKLVITFEVERALFSRSHFAIPAKLHFSKGDRINESLLHNELSVCTEVHTLFCDVYFNVLKTFWCYRAGAFCVLSSEVVIETKSLATGKHASIY